jgi:hypothetical protein
VKVLDFGIAKLGEDSAGRAVHTATYLIFGSPHYMSPEQCRSTARVDNRSDIYSLGVMLFEMLCCERPFPDLDMGVLIAKHQVVESPRLRTKAPGLPVELDELVASMLAKAPEDRPQSMEAVQRALEPFGGRARTALGGVRGAAREVAAGAILMTEYVPTDPGRSPRIPAADSPKRAPSPELLEELRARPRLRVRYWLLGGALVGAAAVTAAVCGGPRGHKSAAGGKVAETGSPGSETGSPGSETGSPGVPSKQDGGNSSLAPDVVLNKILTAYMAGLKRCYKQYLNKEASARGAVALSFTVNETGRLVSGAAKGFAAEVDACIQGQMATWRFPVPKDKDNEATDASFQITLQLVPD